MSTFEKIRNDLQIAHVNQLKYFSGTVKKAPKDEVPFSTKQDIMDWIDEQEKRGRIQKAKANRKYYCTLPNNCFIDLHAPSA